MQTSIDVASMRASSRSRGSLGLRVARAWAVGASAGLRSCAGVRCGIRLSESRHLMPALRPSGMLRRRRPSQSGDRRDWDSTPGSRLPRQRCSRIAAFNHPAIPSNTVRFPPPADHAVPNPRSGLAAPSEPVSPRAAQSLPACGMTIPPTRCRPFSRIAMGARPTATPGLFERADEQSVISACPARSTRFASILGVRGHRVAFPDRLGQRSQRQIVASLRRETAISTSLARHARCVR